VGLWFVCWMEARRSPLAAHAPGDAWCAGSLQLQDIRINEVRNSNSKLTFLGAFQILQHFLTLLTPLGMLVHVDAFAPVASPFMWDSPLDARYSIDAHALCYPRCGPHFPLIHPFPTVGRASPPGPLRLFTGAADPTHDETPECRLAVRRSGACGPCITHAPKTTSCPATGQHTRGPPYTVQEPTGYLVGARRTPPVAPAGPRSP